MLSQLGVTFTFNAQSAIQQMNQLNQAFGTISSASQGGANQTVRHLQSISAAAHQTANQVKSAANMMKAAFAGIVASKIFSGIGKMISAQKGEDEWSDFMRQTGTTEQQMAQYNDHLRKMRQILPGVDGSQYKKGAYDVASLYGAENTEMIQKDMETLGYFQKSLGPDVGTDQAAKIMQTWSGSYGIGKKGDELLKGRQKFAAEMQAASMFGDARPEYIAHGVGHTAGIYSSLGKSSAEMVTDLSMIIPALGERGGFFWPTGYDPIEIKD